MIRHGITKEPYKTDIINDVEMIDLEPYGYPGYWMTEIGKVYSKELNGYVNEWKGGIANLKHDGKSNRISLFKLRIKVFGSKLDGIPEKDKKNLEFIELPGYTVTRDGRVWSHFYNKWLKLSDDKDGYKRVTLANNNYKKTNRVNRLVALAFVHNPDPINKDQVNHKDGNKQNNNDWNLEWCTNQENIDHARNTGLRPIVATNDQVHEICLSTEEGTCVRDIHNLTEVPIVIINAIRYGRIHTGISNKYKLPTSKTKPPTLPIKQVHEICKLLEKETSVSKISKLLNVPTSTISNINQRINYKYVSDHYNIPKCKKRGKVLSVGKVEEICKMLEDGVWVSQISRTLGVNKSTITNIKRRDNHKEISKKYNF